MYYALPVIVFAAENMMKPTIDNAPPTPIQAAADIIGSVYTLIAQRLVKDVNGKVFAVREHLILSPQLKEELLLIDDIHAQQKFIRELMINSDGSDPNISKSFRKQADDLLKAGRLHEDYYYKLIY